MSALVDPIALAEKVLAILSNGSFSATYKYALLLAIVDLCIEKVGRKGLHGEDVTVTTREIAGRVVDLYWPQCVPWKDNRVLRQYRSQGKNAAIVSAVSDFRRKVGLEVSAVNVARRTHEGEFQKLLGDVERTLVRDPIPRLQIIWGREDRFLYDYAWDLSSVPLRGAEYDNILKLCPGVAAGLIRLNATLRPIIQDGWLREVRRMNGLADVELETFLFSRERESLQKVRVPLLHLQEGECFFCKVEVVEKPQVDHFLPWARFPTNVVENLVVAHAGCNASKNDFLASERHVLSWTNRAKEHSDKLEKIGIDHGLGSDRPRILNVAAGIYSQLPESSLLWDGKEKFEPLERDKILKLLRAA